MKDTVYTERGAIDPLLQGKTVLVKGIGNSMTPILKSGQVVLVEPIYTLEGLHKGDIVLTKVKGHVYLHKITGIRKDRVQISNNHGRVNGWTSLVYGKVVKKYE